MFRVTARRLFAFGNLFISTTATFSQASKYAWTLSLDSTTRSQSLKVCSPWSQAFTYDTDRGRLISPQGHLRRKFNCRTGTGYLIHTTGATWAPAGTSKTWYGIYLYVSIVETIDRAQLSGRLWCRPIIAGGFMQC